MSVKKYKVGDKVIIGNLIEGVKYGENRIPANDDMEELSGQIATITNVEINSNGSIYYSINLDHGDYTWVAEMFTGKAKTAKTKAVTPTTEDILKQFADIIKTSNEKNNEQIKQIVERFSDNVTTIDKSINKISQNLNNRTIYDEEIINTIKTRIDKMPTDELKDTIKTETDAFIKKQYGVLPKKIEIKINNDVKQISGLFHKKFDIILKIVQRGVPLMLTGPAGAGKNHTLEQVAEALDLEFYFTNAVTQEYKLTGFIDANGVYQETQFYKAFKDGGLFFLDEVDASCPEALIILNSAIANGYFDFPNGKVKVNENFRVVCAGNTYGTGADMVYVGRNALDGATLDRFVVIEFNYDEDIERQLAYDNELYNFIKNLRDAVESSSLRYIISMRCIINATKLLEIDINKKDILKDVIIKNMQIDDLNIIINKINDNNEWAKLLKAYVNARG